MRTIVFIGAATYDAARIQRPNTEAEFIELQNEFDKVAFVDPEYAFKRQNDYLLFEMARRYPEKIEVSPYSSSHYFSTHAYGRYDSMVIMDFSGSMTRYDLQTLHKFPYDIGNVHYFPHGCFGYYRFEPEIWRMSQSPLIPKPTDLVANGQACSRFVCFPGSYQSNDLTQNEEREFKNDIGILISYIIARFHLSPTPKWINYKELTFIEGFDRLGVDKVVEMLVNAFDPSKNQIDSKNRLNVLERLRRAINHKQ